MDVFAHSGEKRQQCARRPVGTIGGGRGCVVLCCVVLCCVVLCWGCVGVVLGLCWGWGWVQTFRNRVLRKLRSNLCSPFSKSASSCSMPMSCSHRHGDWRGKPDTSKRGRTRERTAGRATGGATQPRRGGWVVAAVGGNVKMWGRESFMRLTRGRGEFARNVARRHARALVAMESREGSGGGGRGGGGRIGVGSAFNACPCYRRQGRGFTIHGACMGVGSLLDGQGSWLSLVHGSRRSHSGMAGGGRSWQL